MENGQPVMGIIYQPYTEELFYGERGKGAFLDEIPIHVSQTARPEDSLIFIGPNPYYKEQHGNRMMEVTKRIYFQCQDIRSSGTKCRLSITGHVVFWPTAAAWGTGF